MYDLSESSSKWPELLIDSPAASEYMSALLPFKFSALGKYGVWRRPYWIYAWLQLPQCTFELQKHCFTSLCISSIVKALWSLILEISFVHKTVMAVCHLMSDFGRNLLVFYHDQLLPLGDQISLLFSYKLYAGCPGSHSLEPLVSL